MIAELKPCPFCRAELDEQAPGYFAHPASTECILSMQEYDFDGAPELADLWNRRAQPAEEVQPVGEIARTDMHGVHFRPYEKWPEIGTPLYTRPPAADADRLDAERYRKLRRWMGSNVPEGWQQVKQLGAVCAWMGWDEMDAMLDDMPDCNVGLATSASTSVPAKVYAKYLIERQDGIGVGWETLMAYSTIEQVGRALPYWSKDSKRPLRVVFEKRAIIDAALAASKEKKE